MSAHRVDDLEPIRRSIDTIEPPRGTNRPWTDDFSDLISVTRWDR
jgi:hypothetical protein